jgi:hypothetical protein
MHQDETDETVSRGRIFSGATHKKIIVLDVAVVPID